MTENLKSLVGKKVLKIFMNEDYLKFETDGGSFTFETEGDCCSQSVFYDFIGVKKLLENGPIISIRMIYPDPSNDKKMYQESVNAYGCELVTEHPTFGEMTSVFSFRNYSNTYYGGWIQDTEDQDVSPEITDDVLETASYKNP
jgi:hypothetical protein